jgi:hypothetical protein
MPRPATAFSPQPMVQNSAIPSAARRPNSSQVYPRRSVLGCLPVAVRLDPVRGEVAVQQERQHERQHLGLASSVVAPQQQPAVVKPEFLGVVVEHVDQAGPQRLPPLRTGCWQH